MASTSLYTVSNIGSNGKKLVLEKAKKELKKGMKK